jgi:hypothetical protein
MMLTGGVRCDETLLSRALLLDLPRTIHDVALVANAELLRRAHQFLVRLCLLLEYDEETLCVDSLLVERASLAM